MQLLHPVAPNNDGGMLTCAADMNMSVLGLMQSVLMVPVWPL